MTIPVSPEALGTLPLLLAVLAATLASALPARRAAPSPVRVPARRRPRG